jgi:GT2 family glycosyltransferase
MFDKLTELISNGEYNEALYEFQEEFFHIDERTPDEAAKLCILEASLWEVLSDSQAEFDAIARGLSYNPGDYELFYMLGLYYLNLNIDQAYLCMEMAAFYCDDEADREVILDTLSDLKCTPSVRVRNTSIMILSYNDLEIMKDCIKSVEDFCPAGTFEIVVVDNASTQEGVREYLREKRDSADYPFILIENEENVGFPKGCNIGAAACNKDNDIFFLNNDAVLMQNSLFFLRMGLYDSRDVGACSAFSNSASLQEIDTNDLWDERPPYKEAVEIFRKYARKNGVPKHLPYIKRFRLTGFALLLSRDAVGSIAADGQVFDEAFSPAYFEDDDLGIRIARAGFKQYLCKNSLIYHNGGGFGGNNEAMEKGREKFIQKWGFDIWNYSMPWIETCDRILELAAEKKGVLRVADFTCDFGANAAYLKSTFPDIYVAGVCNNPFAAGIAHNIVDDVIYGDLNCIRIPWPEHSFDVVIAEKKNVSKGQIGRCLKADGTTFLYEE